MTHNDILRRLRFALDLSDARVRDLTQMGGVTVDEAGIRARMLPEEDPETVYCDADTLAAFLDGLILDRRGPRDPSKPAPPEANLDNNQILKKLRIALNLREAAMLRILDKGGHTLSKHELTALFRKPEHKHYREAGGQLLRRFLKGLTLELRPDVAEPDDEPSDDEPSE